MAATPSHTQGDKAFDVFVALVVTMLGPAIGAILHSRGLHLSRPELVVVGEGPAAISVAALVTKWRWWRRVGWRLPEPRSVWLLWFPTGLVLLSILGSPKVAVGPARAVAAGVAVLVVGFAEEMWFRGLLLESLLGRGALTATLGSAVLFGALHLPNTRTFGLSSAGFQALGAFAIGLVFAACRIRIGALWPLVVLHAATDFFFVAGHSKPTPLSVSKVPNVVFLVASCSLYSLVLMRRRNTPPIVS